MSPLRAAEARLALAALLHERLAEAAAVAQWTNADVMGRIGELVLAESAAVVLPLLAVVPRCYVSGAKGRYRLFFAEAEPQLPGAGAGGDRAHLEGEEPAQPGGPHSAHEGYGYSVTERSLRQYGIWKVRNKLAVLEPGWFYLANRWGSASHNTTKTFQCQTAAGSRATGHVREEGVYGNVRPAGSTVAGGATVEELLRLPEAALHQRFRSQSKAPVTGLSATGLSAKHLAHMVADSAAEALASALLVAESDAPTACLTFRPLLLRPRVEVRKRHDHMCEERSMTTKAKAVRGPPPGYVLARVTAVEDTEPGVPPIASEIWIDGRRYTLATTERQHAMRMTFN